MFGIIVSLWDSLIIALYQNYTCFYVLFIEMFGDVCVIFYFEKEYFNEVNN